MSHAGTRRNLRRGGEGKARAVRIARDTTDHRRHRRDGRHGERSSLNAISLAVSQMDKATQQNAAMVEETTAATHGLAND